MRNLRRRTATLLGGLVLLILIVLLLAPPNSTVRGMSPSRSAETGARAISGLRVEGNQIINAAGDVVQLRGFNHSGAEYACVEGWGIFDTPNGSAPSDAMLAAMRSWRGANAVRIPLNQACWLGSPSLKPNLSGERYRAEIVDLVERLNRLGFAVVLDLHRSAPGDALPLEQEQLPDRDHSPKFWHSVAARFATNTSVVFDLFNEPFPFEEYDTERAWRCWRDGGCVLTSENSGESYVAAGMSELIASIRATGSRHVVFVGGLHWAEVLTRWEQYRPADPIEQLGASFHGYSFNDYCADIDCYERDLGPISETVPLLAGEIGPDLPADIRGFDRTCPAEAVTASGFSRALLDWLDERAASYTAWTWNPTGDCWALITAWGGQPSQPWGAELRSRLSH